MFQTISFHKLHTKTTGSVPGSSVVSGNNLDKQFPTSRSYIQCGLNVFPHTVNMHKIPCTYEHTELIYHTHTKILKLLDIVFYVIMPIMINIKY